jgi:ABC-2 type transport system ATP-binding protein
MDAIRVDHLSKKFANFTAVDDLTFSVAQGELFGLLGPNGAGKTTTINMLATLLRPTAGAAEIGDISILRQPDAVRHRIGIVFQDPALDSKLTGRENLEFHAMMYGLNKTKRRERVASVLQLVELQERADVLVEKYSGGMKRRLEIARGLIQQPLVLFLDEPTLGLDAQTRRKIWDYIRRLNREKGVSIILTTHYMEEADFLCDRVAIMDKGKFVAIDKPERLKDLLGGDVVSLELAEGSAALLSDWRNTPWIKSVTPHDGVVSLTMERAERRIPELIQMAQERSVVVHCVNIRKPSLEDVFLHFTGRTIREEESGLSQQQRDRFHRQRRRGR